MNDAVKFLQSLCKITFKRRRLGSTNGGATDGTSIRQRPKVQIMVILVSGQFFFFPIPGVNDMFFIYRTNK